MYHVSTWYYRQQPRWNLPRNLEFLFHGSSFQTKDGMSEQKNLDVILEMEQSDFDWNLTFGHNARETMKHSP